MMMTKIILSRRIGVRHISEDQYYNGPLVGYTKDEMITVLGLACLQAIEANDMEIVWKRKD